MGVMDSGYETAAGVGCGGGARTPVLRAPHYRVLLLPIPSLARYNPCPGVMPNVPASRGYTGGFGSALMAKDLGLALDAAKAVGAPLPTAAAAHQVYQMMLTQGFSNKDFSAVWAFLHGSATDAK